MCEELGRLVFFQEGFLVGRGGGKQGGHVFDGAFKQGNDEGQVVDLPLGEQGPTTRRGCFPTAEAGFGVLWLVVEDGGGVGVCVCPLLELEVDQSAVVENGEVVGIVGEGLGVEGKGGGVVPGLKGAVALLFEAFRGVFVGGVCVCSRGVCVCGTGSGGGVGFCVGGDGRRR